MSVKELDRSATLRQVQAGQLTKSEAARQLGISRQHLYRLSARYLKEGPQGLLSKRRGAPSNNRIAESVRHVIVSTIREKYADFKPGLAHEKLIEAHGFTISDESVRQLMIGAGLWKGKSRKAIRVHQMRARRSCYGELIQIDGSPHDWFEGRRTRCCLLVFIDDATSALVGLRFVENECLEGYYQLMRQYLLAEGRPVALYSDRHTIFHVPEVEAKNSSGETQFGRSMRELDIELIPAFSPQAKGRVERANGILQDRLVKEMRLRQINDIDSAHAYLPEFMKDYNRRFAVEPTNPNNAHRETCLTAEQLNLILCIHEERVLSKNLELSYHNILYQVQIKNAGRRLRGAKVTICDQQGHVTLLYKGQSLEYTTFDKRSRPKQAVSGKELNQVIDTKITKAKSKKPSTSHPWRQYQNVQQNKSTPRKHHLTTSLTKQLGKTKASALPVCG